MAQILTMMTPTTDRIIISSYIATLIRERDDLLNELRPLLIREHDLVCTMAHTVPRRNKLIAQADILSCIELFKEAVDEMEEKNKLALQICDCTKRIREYTILIAQLKFTLSWYL